MVFLPVHGLHVEPRLQCGHAQQSKVQQQEEVQSKPAHEDTKRKAQDIASDQRISSSRPGHVVNKERWH